MAVIPPGTPYSSHLGPSDFLLYQEMKLQLPGCCFLDVPKIQEQLLTTPHMIPKRVVPGAILAVAEMLDPLHKLRRG
jgi:hypothetical protein